MATLRERRGTLALTTISILLSSVAASAVGATYLYSVGDNEPPVAQIASIADGEVLQAGTIEIKGAAVDDSAVQAVSVRVDDRNSIPVIPNHMNDFTGWSLPLDLPPGNHTIEVETIDDQGKRNSTKISVEVYDKVMKVPADNIVEATGPLGALVDYSPPSLKKNTRISGGPECSPASGNIFPIGTTTVTCIVSFASGNMATDDFTVSVRDSTPPTIIAPPDVTAKNNGSAFIKLSLGTPQVKDDVDADPEVYNNVPANGFPLGITKVVWTTQDENGNEATAVQKVTVTGAVSDTISSNTEDSVDDGGSITHTVSGGGGGSSGGSHKEKDDDKNKGGNGSGNGSKDDDSTPATQYTLVINSVDSSGKSISMPATINAINGTTLRAGGTPLTFTGDDSAYTLTMFSSNDMTFDHWENGATTPTREINLDHDITLTAHFISSTTPTDDDTLAPTIIATPSGGKYGTPQSVILVANEAANIYYTTNGNNPTTSSSVYISSISISTTTTLKYIGKDTADNISPVYTQAYIIDTIRPSVTATPIGGTYSSTQSVILTASEPSTIYYTKDGSTPTTSSPVYSSPILITSTTTLKYFARDTVGNSGVVATQVYMIDTTSPTVTASPLGGAYTSAQSVTLTASEPATIYYTTNGNTPTTSSTVYSSPITIASTTTLKYFAKDAAGNSGNVITQTYTINTADTAAPLVAITQPAANSVVSTIDGNIIVTGTSSDGGSGVKVIEVRVDSGSYITATPKAAGDWSVWSVTVPITAGERRLVPRATDNAGNQAWNSIYVAITDSPSGGGDSDTLDDFGIEKIYPTASGGNEWYVNMNDPTSDPLFRNLPSMTKQPDGSWQVSASQVRMEAWSPSGEKWLNVEITGYAKIVSGSNELIQWYSRGGHHTSSNECLGSAYKARLYGDGEARWVKEVTHPAYTSNKGFVQATDDPLRGRWIGFKAVIYNFVEDGNTYVRLESYIDDDVTDSSGNLLVKNNWKLASVVEDKGGWSTSNPDFNTTCAPMNKDSTQQYRQRDEILNLSGGTSTQNIAAWRSDSLTWNWKYLSVREIVPS